MYNSISFIFYYYFNKGEITDNSFLLINIETHVFEYLIIKFYSNSLNNLHNYQVFIVFRIILTVTPGLICVNRNCMMKCKQGYLRINIIESYHSTLILHRKVIFILTNFHPGLHCVHGIKLVFILNVSNVQIIFLNHTFKIVGMSVRIRTKYKKKTF